MYFYCVIIYNVFLYVLLVLAVSQYIIIWVNEIFD